MNLRNVSKPMLALVITIVVAACGQAPTHQPQIQAYETMKVATADKALKTNY